jgi:CheY-like chemotaxis protein
MPNLKDDKHVTVLIAEDDDGHAELILELLREVGIQNPARRFRDGQEVMDFFADRVVHPDPQNGACLLLLDIRMPRMDGVEVLRRMKADPWLKAIPVVMLTTTDDPREIQGCYELGCNCYVTKPIEFDQFTAALKQLGLFLLIMQVPAVTKA